MNRRAQVVFLSWVGDQARPMAKARSRPQRQVLCQWIEDSGIIRVVNEIDFTEKVAAAAGDSARSGDMT